MHHPADPHDHGLGEDLKTLLAQAARRRQALRWLLAGGTVAAASGLLAGCGGGGSSDGSSSTASTTGGTGTGTGTTTGTGTGTGTSTGTTTSCSVIPEETAGPYPGDGSNSSAGGIANALILSGIVRSDIRSSVAGASGVASGIPLSLRLRLVHTGSSCASLAGYAIYLWHCDALGRYSMYSSGVTAENYLRGVQATDSNGEAVFSTIYPGCYDGRVPHMHFEIYRSLTSATQYSNKLRTSQLAFPDAISRAVYATSGYGNSATNNARVSLASDGIFSDGSSTQVVTISGDVSSGYSATLQVGIAA